MESTAVGHRLWLGVLGVAEHRSIGRAGSVSDGASLMLFDPQIIGMTIALCGGIALFMSDERKRQKQSGLVPVEALEERTCPRCWRAAKVCRFDGERWRYGASERCLYDHCNPAGILGGAVDPKIGALVTQRFERENRIWVLLATGRAC